MGETMPMHSHCLTALAALVLYAGVAGAQTRQATRARIDVYAVDAAIELRPAGASPDAKVGFCSWLGDGREKTGLTSEAPLGREWRKLWLAFVPEADGQVDIDLQGEWYRSAGPDDVRLVWADDVSVEGADISNGGFEEAGPEGRPAVWRFTGDFGAERYSTDDAVARSGRSCVSVWYGSQGRQKFAVSAGHTYRVSAWFRAIDPSAVPRRIHHAASVPAETYDQELVLTFADPDAARRATFRCAPLYQGREWSVSARWDDNNTADLKMRDVMEAHGYRGTFYLTGDRGMYGPDGGSTNPAELGRKLLEGGNTIGGHSMTHPYLSYLNRNRRFWEVAAVRMLWEARIDRPINSYAFSFCDFRRGVDGDAVQTDIAESLRRAGYLDIANGWFNDQMDTDLLLSPILPSDGAPIEATAETWLSDPGRRVTSPHMSFSMHVWYSTPEAWGRFANQLDAYGARPNWWYCNQNQYAAYRGQATRTRLGARPADGARVVLSLERPALQELGDDVPLTLCVDGVARREVLAASSLGREAALHTAPDGTVLVDLEHDAVQALPRRIGYIDNPGNASAPTEANADPDFPGLQGVLHAAGGELQLSLANETGTPLGSLLVTYRLPPACEPGVVHVHMPQLPRALTDTLALSRVGPDYRSAAGQAFYAAQVDFTWQGQPARLHLSCTAAVPERDPSYPQGGFLVAGPLDEAAIAALDLPRDAWDAGGAGLSWRQERPEDIRVMDPEVIATAGGWRAPDGGRQHWLLRSVVTSPQDRRVSPVSEGDAILAVYVNGEKLTGSTGVLRSGENELTVVGRGSAGGFSRTNAGCFLRIAEPGTRKRIADIEFRRPGPDSR